MGIKKALGRVEDIKRVDYNAEKDIFTVDYDPRIVSPEKISDLVEKHGRRLKHNYSVNFLNGPK